MSKRRSAVGTLLILAGVLLILAAIGLYIYNIWDNRRANAASDEILDALEKYISESAGDSNSDDASSDSNTPSVDAPEPIIPDYILDPQRDMPAVEVDGQRYVGILEIPVLDLKLPVLEKWSYPGLKIAPCRYSGTAYQNNLVIAAHNYDAHFGSIDELKPKDQVIFTDMDNNRFFYEVEFLEILPPTAVEEMTAGEWDFTLFTCNLSGRARVTVRCMAQAGP